MLKTTLTAGLFLCALIFLSGNQVHAAPQGKLAQSDKALSHNTFELGALAADIQKPEDKKEPKEKTEAKPAEVVPVVHTIVAGESLTVVAEKHASTWMRLYSKNVQITDPNIITVGEQITIPSASEVLPERPLPTPPPQAAVAPSQPTDPNNTGYMPAYRVNSTGNTYYAGYCTWYAKDRRPDLPNSLGNADTWVYKAQTMGLATGSAPRAGAIGQQGMHVVYVESVNGDGTVTISEMNYQGPYVISSRTVPAGNFMYIY